MCINIYIHIHVYKYIYAYTYIYMRMSAKVTEWHKRPLRSRYARALPPHRYSIFPHIHRVRNNCYVYKGQFVYGQPANME